MSTAAIGIDLGGTRIKATVVDNDGRILDQLYTPTKDDNEGSWKQRVQDTVRELQNRLQLQNFVVGISAPGIPNQQNTIIAFMPGRLEGLRDFDWSVFLNCKAWILNDAVAALMAEAKMGIAKNRKNVVLLTLGTGVGGAILIDGKPYQGSFQKAGHIGHIAVETDREADITGIPGSLEQAIGNCTVYKRSLGRYNHTDELLAAYKQGEHFARWVWLSSVQKLAIGIASITNTLSPECIVLAGGITEAGNDLFEPLKSFLDIYEWRPGGSQVEILKATFGDQSGAIGAACFALMKTDGKTENE